MQEYVQALKQLEGRQAIVYSKTSCELVENRGRVWTVCILFDPNKTATVDPGLVRKPLFGTLDKKVIKEEMKAIYTESQLLADPL